MAIIFEKVLALKFNQKWVASRYDIEKNQMYNTFEAEVPGNIQYDYAKANNFGDFQFSDNVKKFDEIEDYAWIYCTELDYAAKNDEQIWFVAEGIDYKYDILLDGKCIYSDEGMFTPIEIDITNLVCKGSLLQIVIYPHPKREGAEPCRDQADQSCKPPFCYGWDWNPRLIVSGIWRDAYIETRDSGYIKSCEAFYTLNDTMDTAYVRFVSVCEKSVTYTVLDAENNIVYNGTNPEFTLKNINLWWCNGEGTPYLYSWTAESESHIRRGTIGFRKIRLVHNEGADGEVVDFPKSRYATCITIELNGRRIFAQGSNWVNPELFPGRITEERYNTLLNYATEAGMNMMRIWGGSGINKPEFYNICDRLGLMVWQEFMLACNNYVGTPQYLSVLEKEATSIIRCLRCHPCIVMWCGGNELFNDWSGMDDQSTALRLLNKLCYEEDFGKPFLATSPLYGMAHGGYSFIDLFNGKDVFEIFNNSNNVAYTEFGLPAMSSVEQLKKIIPENELFPVRKTKAWVCHHGFDAWIGDSHIHPQMLKKLFGEPKSLANMVEQSEKLQAAGYKAIFEEARRQWPHCSMAINWCFDEPWITAANLSLISYPDLKRQSYYAVKDALRQVMASARIPHFEWKAGEKFTAELWFLNSSNNTESETITAVIEVDGKEYEQFSWNTGEVKARTNKLGPQVNFILPEITDCNEFTLILKTSDSSKSSRYTLNLIPCEEKPKKKQLNL